MIHQLFNTLALPPKLMRSLKYFLPIPDIDFLNREIIFDVVRHVCFLVGGQSRSVAGVSQELYLDGIIVECFWYRSCVYLETGSWLLFLEQPRFIPERPSWNFRQLLAYPFMRAFIFGGRYIRAGIHDKPLFLLIASLIPPILDRYFLNFVIEFFEFLLHSYMPEFHTCITN